MTDFATARRRMVDNQLRTSSVTDHRILKAMETIPRERFVPAARQQLAYADATHNLGGGRVLGAPAPFARLIQLAEIDHTDTVLDVGTGSGYSAAVLSRLAAGVTGLESDPELAAAARDNLAGVSGSVSIVDGPLDGTSMSPGTFDVIVVEGAVSEVPRSLLRLLKDGGRLVVLVNANGPGVATVYVSTGGEVAARTEFNSVLPPLGIPKGEDQFVF
jgi:protein-L-isoaspartate(D-aspartate) O-methyltransferase